MNGAVDLPLGLSELSFEATGGARVRRSILPSGVRVLSERVPGSRSVTIGFWVAVGSRDEQGADATHPASYGSTHFLEHLLFKGTPTRSALDIAISFDSVGGEHNALTAKEYTCYYAKVQDRDLPMAVAVLADMFTSSLLDPAEFENERGVILEELSMAGDDPADVANERFFEAVLGQHALGRPIGGDPETIRSATRSAVAEHYRANYRPQDLFVIVAGAVDHDALIVELERALGTAGWDLSVVAAPVGHQDAAAGHVRHQLRVRQQREADRRRDRPRRPHAASGAAGSARRAGDSPVGRQRSEPAADVSEPDEDAARLRTARVARHRTDRVD